MLSRAKYSVIIQQLSKKLFAFFHDTVFWGFSTAWVSAISSQWLPGAIVEVMKKGGEVGHRTNGEVLSIPVRVYEKNLKPDTIPQKNLVAG